jgi:hypothetical protein
VRLGAKVVVLPMSAPRADASQKPYRSVSLGF